MKTDLAPKSLYYYNLFVWALGLIGIGVVHQYTMDHALKSSELTPFIITSVFGTIMMLGIAFTLNKCRYITINPTDEKKFIIGNIFTNTHGHTDKLTIVKKVWPNLFKINFEGKNYFILSFDNTVDEYRQRMNR